MLNELLEFIGTLEWQESKHCPVNSVINRICFWFFCSACGYLTGQAICIIFGIGILGAK